MAFYPFLITWLLWTITLPVYLNTVCTIQLYISTISRVHISSNRTVALIWLELPWLRKSLYHRSTLNAFSLPLCRWLVQHKTLKPPCLLWAGLVAPLIICITCLNAKYHTSGLLTSLVYYQYNWLAMLCITSLLYRYHWFSNMLQ